MLHSLICALSSARPLVTLALLAGLTGCSTPVPPAATSTDEQCKASPGDFSLANRHQIWAKALIDRDADALKAIYEELPVHVDGTLLKDGRTRRPREQVIAHLIQKTEGQTIHMTRGSIGGEDCGAGYSISSMTLVDQQGASREVTYMLYWTLVGKDWKVQAQYFGQTL